MAARRLRVGLHGDARDPAATRRGIRSFPAACHYVDGTSWRPPPRPTARREAPSGAKFGFWHPDFVTLHLWAWYPNPDGIYNGTNRLVRPFNG